MRIQLHDVSKAFIDKSEGNVAFTLEVGDIVFSQGEIHVLRGKSGCGKTTLLSLIALLDDPDAGTRLIDGQAIGAKERKALGKADGLRSRFFYLPAEPIVAPGLTVKELYRAYGFPDVGEALLASLGLVGYGDRLVQSLSRGEQARVLIALACQSEADALVLDEPAGNLNDENKAKVYSLLRKEAEKRLVVIASHDYDEDRDGPCRLILMDKGKVVEDRGGSLEIPCAPHEEAVLAARKPALAPLLKAGKYSLRDMKPRVCLLGVLSFLAGVLSSFGINLSFYDPSLALLDLIKGEDYEIVSVSLGTDGILSEDALAKARVYTEEFGFLDFVYGHGNSVSLYGQSFRPEDGVAYVPSCYADDFPSSFEVDGVNLTVEAIEREWARSTMDDCPILVSEKTGADIALADSQVMLRGNRSEEVAKALVSEGMFYHTSSEMILAPGRDELRELARGDGRGAYIVYNEALSQAPEYSAALERALMEGPSSSGPGDIPSGPIEFLGFLPVGNLCMTGCALLPTDQLYEEIHANSFFSGSFSTSPIESYPVDQVNPSWLLSNSGNLVSPSYYDYPQIPILQGISAYALPVIWAASSLLALVMLFVAFLVKRIAIAAVGPLALRLRISGLSFWKSTLALFFPLLLAFLIPSLAGTLAYPILLPIKDLMVRSLYPTFYEAFPFSIGGYFFGLLIPVLCLSLAFLSLFRKDRKTLMEELRRSEE